MERLELPFTVVPGNADETFEPGVPPEQMVVRLAERKARAIAGIRPDALVIGADTTVVIDGIVLNKPADAADAAHMLRRLRGRPHEVLTGLALLHPDGRVQTGVVSSFVLMREYTDDEIAAYVATGEPLDKAGAYAIQGGAGVFVARIEGCYFNVVGLPLCELVTLLARLDIDPAPTGIVCLRPDGAPCPRLSHGPAQRAKGE
jgi:septum formation protein